MLLSGREGGGTSAWWLARAAVVSGLWNGDRLGLRLDAAMKTSLAMKRRTTVRARTASWVLYCARDSVSAASLSHMFHTLLIHDRLERAAT